MRTVIKSVCNIHARSHNHNPLGNEYNKDIFFN